MGEGKEAVAWLETRQTGPVWDRTVREGRASAVLSGERSGACSGGLARGIGRETADPWECGRRDLQVARLASEQLTGAEVSGCGVERASQSRSVSCL